MENYKEVGNINCQNDMKSLNINNSIMNDTHETASTFNGRFLTVAGIVK